MPLKEPRQGDVGGGPIFLFSSSDGGLMAVVPVPVPTGISSGISVTLLSLPRLDPFGS